MNILMVGNPCDQGSNLKKGLLEKGHNVILVGNKSVWFSNMCDYELNWSNSVKIDIRFDIVHIHSPNLKKVWYCKKYKKQDTIVLFHWHGSDIKYRLKRFGITVDGFADYHLYSTIDLGWFLRMIPRKKREWFMCAVDTDMFQDYGNHNGYKIFDNEHRLGLPREEMPKEYNKYEKIKVLPRQGMDEHLISVTALEGASCGCKIEDHPYMNREWVIKNASINSQTDKLLGIYDRLIAIENLFRIREEKDKIVSKN